MVHRGFSLGRRRGDFVNGGALARSFSGCCDGISIASRYFRLILRPTYILLAFIRLDKVAMSY